jgi:hypothetical protein
MSNLSEKTTLYLNPYVKKFLQLRALQENRSISELVNNEFADLLEDFEDLKEVQRRKNESFIEWEIVKKELDKKHGL